MVLCDSVTHNSYIDLSESIFRSQPLFVCSFKGQVAS